MSREIRETWLERGGTTLGERLNEKVTTIIADHQPEPLAADKKQRLQEIVEEARG